MDQEEPVEQDEQRPDAKPLVVISYVTKSGSYSKGYGHSA